MALTCHHECKHDVDPSLSKPHAGPFLRIAQLADLVRHPNTLRRARPPVKAIADDGGCCHIIRS